ncbi:hypothetical protein AB0K52_22280 [Glycomyces sp. NPDC049804]|uniref:DUF7574 domain-containing protein n=1 Tax=Glycomyces sp. NPDC049804 TaxID=3154363 RepID=UPI0034463B16
MHESSKPDMIEALQALINHPRTPKHEKTAAQEALRRLKQRRPAASKKSKSLPCIECQPESHGLETVGDVSWTDEHYEYDVTVLFADRKTGALFIGSDSGCSCPHPFEDMTRDDLDPIADINELQACLHALAGGPRVDNPRAEAEIVELLERVRARQRSLGRR